MKVIIDPDIQKALRPLTDQELSDLRERLKSEGCTQKFPYAMIDGVPTQLDAHHRRQICLEEKLEFGWLLIAGVTTKDQAIDWVMAHQLARRNLTLAQVRKIREARVGRVAEAKAKGKSIRAIAEEEGVSAAQVRRDLDEEEEEKNSSDAKDYAIRRLKKCGFQDDEQFRSISYDGMKQEIVKAYRAGARTKKKFQIPTLEEVTAYCKQRKSNVDPAAFMAHYESNGWMIGNTPMKRWQSAVITWEKNNGKFAGNSQPEMFGGLKEFLAEGDPNEAHPGGEKG